MFQAETLHAHQEIIDYTAAGAAQSFFRRARDCLSSEEITLLDQARALTLRRIGVSKNILFRLNIIFAQSPRLTYLNIAGNQIGETGARGLDIDELLSLQTLELGLNAIGFSGARNLRARLQ